MADKLRRLAGFLRSEFPRAAEVADAARAFGNRLLGAGLEPNYAMAYYHAHGELQTTRHRADRVRLLMERICRTDPCIRYVELWEANADGFRLLTRVGGKPVSTTSSERGFVACNADFRALNAMKGYVVLFNGGKTILFNLKPGDFNVEGTIDGLSFGENGCWVPIGNIIGEKTIEVTHLLTVYGEISQRADPGNQQLNFLVTMARWIGDQLYSQRMEERSNIDPLTGLWNRRFFSLRLSEATLGSIVRRRSVAIAILDLDHFKRVNDTYGHIIGDQVLGDVGSALRSRLGGVWARYGGEEFAYIESGLPPRTALEKAGEIHRVFSPLPCHTECGVIDVRASIGVVSSAIWNRLRTVERFPEGPKRDLIDPIRSRLGLMNRLRADADEQMRKLRGIEEIARTLRSASHDFDDMLGRVEGPLKEYAREAGLLWVSLADAAAYFVKETGRNGLATPFVENGELSFRRLEFTEPGPSAPSAAEGDPLQLSLPGQQNSHS